MNKLFKFAGVSALALVTAAPNAFGEGGYGQYNPSCPEKRGIPINVYGFEGGKYKKLEDIKFAYNPVDQQYILNGAGITSWQDVLDELKTAAPGTIDVYKNSTNTTKGDVTITTSLVPYAVGVLGGGGGKPFNDMLTAAATAVPYNYIATTSTCAIPSKLIEKAWIRQFTDGRETTPTLDYELPDIQEWAYGDNGEMVAEFSFLVFYAAQCISEADQENTAHATCLFNVDDEGRVTYKNSCMAGYTTANNGMLGAELRVCIQDIEIGVDTSPSPGSNTQPEGQHG